VASKLIALLAVLMLAGLCSRVDAQMKEYQTRYYTIYTDIDPQDEKEAEIRMTRMAEEYHERTRDFSGQIRDRLPFYLFKTSAEYYAAGGMKGSAGVFSYSGSGGKLMAIAGQKSSLQTWHVVQHEGFHQFAHMAIRGNMPTWLNEGLAEYFGEAIWTGDGFVTGAVPPWRFTRLKEEINAGQLKSFQSITHLTPQAWADQLNIQNYDQAWSMVHFFVHADDQKYQPGLSECIREMSNGVDSEKAMRSTIAQYAGVEDRWKSWWLEQPDSPTPMLYAKAATATLTSFVARAAVRHQTFADFDAFHDAALAGNLKISDTDWLPQSLLNDAFRLWGNQFKWSLAPGLKKQPEVIATMDDGTRLVGSYSLRGNNTVDHVDVLVDDMAVVLKNARQLLDQNKKEQARLMIQNALRQNPKSAMADDAKKLLLHCR
jgi:hypothetical protein